MGGGAAATTGAGGLTATTGAMKGAGCVTYAKALRLLFVLTAGASNAATVSSGSRAVDGVAGAGTTAAEGVGAGTVRAPRSVHPETAASAAIAMAMAESRIANRTRMRAGRHA